MSLPVFQPTRPDGRECVTCGWVGKCNTVKDKPFLVGEHYYCMSWIPTGNEVVAARLKVINEFGPIAIEAMVKEKED